MISFTTEDGYKFYLALDGKVVDSTCRDNVDMSWDSKQDFLDDMQSNDIPVTIHWTTEGIDY